jgi:PAS domain S-box-containing protein
MFVVAFLGGPFVMYAALMHHAEQEALKDARAFSGVISIVRSYYAANVSGRLLAAPGHAAVTERYRDIPGAVPIPATLSIELAEMIKLEAIDQSLRFDFVSDAPFRNRPRPPLSEFQSDALSAFRLMQTSGDDYWRIEDDPSGTPRMRLAIPVRMEPGCIACHNAHPDSPVRTWRVGDVRGIQDVSVDLSIIEQASQSGLLAAYMIFFAFSGVLAVAESRRNNSRLLRSNEDLEASRRTLEERRQALSATVAELGTKTNVLDKAPFGIFIAEPVDDGLRMVYVNAAFCAQTGFRADEALGGGLSLLRGPMTSPEALAKAEEAIRECQACEVELAIHRRDGTPLWTRLLLFPSFGGDGRLQHHVGCVTDISEIRRAADERQRLAGELQESMKLESLGLTIAGIAHDLNTPIGVAITAASHLEANTERFAAAAEQAPLSADQAQRFVTGARRSLALVRSNLHKAAVLVRSFKQTTADATREEWRVVNVKSFLDTLIVSVSPLIRRAGCEVRIACPEGLAQYTEPGALGRVLTNLLVNASIHAFEGRDERRVQLDVCILADTLRISCTDNGNGMTEEAMAKVFTPFFTTRRASGGSGLGLFSSRRTVETVLGGKLTMETRAGSGTAFHIDLPLRRHA